jgi:hypothetical protein
MVQIMSRSVPSLSQAFGHEGGTGHVAPGPPLGSDIPATPSGIVRRSGKP